MNEIRAEVVENEKTSDYDANNYQVDLLFDELYHGHIKDLSKKEADIIVQRINEPSRIKEIIEEMKKECDYDIQKAEERNFAYSGAIDYIKIRGRKKLQKYILDELLKRLVKGEK